MARPELSLAEAVCLALIAESPRHGWALVRDLAPDGPIGRVWTLSRPLTYRAIDGLLAHELVVHQGEEAGAGPRRQVLAASPAGRRAIQRWLAEPVGHLRDVRTELLVKLVLTERVGGDARSLLEAQRARFAPIVAAQRAAGRGSDADAVARWRAASAEAVDRFLADELRRHRDS